MKHVKELYEKWVYPEPVSDMVAAIKSGYLEHNDLPYYGNIYWHDRSTFDGLDILIAGCGPNSAAYNAIRNPACKVVGIDISETSLNHCEDLKRKHGITNLELYNIAIEDLYKLKKKFHYILCSGVLHHLEDPPIGLKCLGSVLQEDGIMSLMLYGKTFRSGIYPLQDVFRKLKLRLEKDDIALARQIIEKLPDWHPARSYVKFTKELEHDSAFADTFLNPVDKAFYVEEIFSLIEACDLEFIGWLDPLPYNHDAVFEDFSVLDSLLRGKSQREVYSIVEKLSFARGTHRFNVCKKEYFPNRLVPDSRELSGSWYPKVRYGLKAIKPATMSSGDCGILQRSFHKFEVSFNQARLLELCDGTNSINDLARTALLPFQEMKNFIGKMYRMGHVLISCK